VLSARTAATAAASPIATPISASAIPWRSTSRSTVFGEAPSAMRTPNSLVRCATPCDSNP
jgi:hypothetical protein